MARFAHRTALLCLVALFPVCAQAKTIASATATPSSPTLSPDNAAAVQLTIAFSGLTDKYANCTYTVNWGDFSPPANGSSGSGDSATQAHTYSTPGTKSLWISGAGSTPCQGGVQVSVTVLGEIHYSAITKASVPDFVVFASDGEASVPLELNFNLIGPDRRCGYEVHWSSGTSATSDTALSAQSVKYGYVHTQTPNTPYSGTVHVRGRVIAGSPRNTAACKGDQIIHFTVNAYGTPPPPKKVALPSGAAAKADAGPAPMKPPPDTTPKPGTIRW